MKSASNIREILAFLRQLAINNDRTWFKARKDQFDALRGPWEQDMQRRIGLVADFDPQARGLIDAEPEEFLSIINNPEITSRYQWISRSLKMIPKGYPKDHPMGRFLKMKEYLLVKNLDESYFDCDDWVERVADDLQPLKPLNDFLNYVFE